MSNTELIKLIEDGLTFGEVVNAFHARMSDHEKAYIPAAQTYTEEGDLEIDDNAIISKGEDHGAYVLAWKWVDAPRLDEWREAVENMDTVMGFTDWLEVTPEPEEDE